VERDPVIEEYKKHVDRTLLRENLKLTVEQRLRNLMELQKLSEELRRAGRVRLRNLTESIRPATPKDLEAVAELEALLEERGG